MLFIRLSFFYLLLWLTPLISQASDPELLPPDKAFKVSAQLINDHIELSFEIAEGYYLYQHRFSVKSQTKAVSLGGIVFPPGETKQDEVFGQVIIYHHHVMLPISLQNPQQIAQLSLEINYQGCAEIGVCYPPQQKIINVTLNSNPDQSNPLKQLVTGVQRLTKNLWADELLPADKAFQFLAEVKDEHTLHLSWIIAEGYYLYRDKIKLRLLNSRNVNLGAYQIPHGQSVHDNTFGQVEIFHQLLQFEVALLRKTTPAETLTLVADFQGCADRGVCYPPMSAEITLKLPITAETTLTANQPVTRPPLAEQNQIATALQQDSLWLTLISFLGFGLLLSFTPCVFPMIPILSSLIVGQGQQIKTTEAFLLSLAYVLASALTYTLFGVLAALFGHNLQIIFQQPWVIALFSGIFVLLSLSMFGLYSLELPKSLQAKLHDSSDKHRDGSYFGVAIMGALSALIVGPCVAAPLAGALIYIGQTGDVILGGLALFMMGLGMGLPLLIIGTSAGKLLPKAGHWLNSTKAIFGVIMLATALWMLERILPAAITLLLWAILFIVAAIYLHALEALPPNSHGWRKLWKGLGLVLFIYGILLLVGMSAGNSNPLAPLQNLGLSNTQTSKKGLAFKRIASLAALETQLEKATASNQWVMLDFYADWCISCKEMEIYTFTNAKVQHRLKNVMVLQADVTENNEADQALLKQFNLMGPPAILFFDPNKKEHSAFRVIGYQDSATFLANLLALGI
jgi:thiol:disulfide interchange protein DsbD